MTKPVRPTAATEWRQRSEVTVTLPSGMVATLRTPSLNMAVRLGYIPDSLTPLVAQMIAAGQKEADVAFNTMADIKKYVELLDALVMSAFVSPKVVADRPADVQSGEISLDDLSDADIGFVASFINAPAGALARFRDQQAHAMESVELEPSGSTLAEQADQAGSVGP